MTALSRFSSAENFSQIAEIRKECGEDLWLYSGNDDQIIENHNNRNQVESINFLEEEITINKGSNYILRYSILPNNVDSILFFNSSDKKIATVDSVGNVIAKKAGMDLVIVDDGWQSVDGICSYRG